MKIAVISDLHIGTGDAADGFAHEERGFLRFLDYLERNFERVVLLGDIFETLRGRFPGRARAELRRVREIRPELARRFRRPAYHYVHGNHDLVARSVDRAPASLTLKADGLRLLFTHGHHHDWVIRHARWLAEVGSCFGGWFMRLKAGFLTRWIEGFQHGLWGDPGQPAKNSFPRWALALARRRDADIIVTGHTHQLSRFEDRGRLFLNSGACNHGQFAFVSLDTKRGQYALHSGW